MKKRVCTILFVFPMIALAEVLLQTPEPPSGRIFEVAGPRSGLDAFTLISGTKEKKYIVEAMAGGVALFDSDNDGLLDIYFVNGGNLDSFREGKPSALKNALFRNLGGRRFVEVTQKAGVGGDGFWGMGCSVADYNNDGFPDLYVTTYGPNILYRNRGDGTFEDATEKAGVNDRRWSTGSAWADFNGDGHLDLFVANYVELDPKNLPEPGSKSHGSMGTATLGCRYMDLDVMCGPRGLKGAGDSFFINNGDGTFAERSRDLGLHDPNGYYGLGATWCDFDGDNDPDLYVANDTTPNYLYRNRGKVTFEEIALLSGAAVNEAGTEQAAMGVACGDYRNEGRFSIYVTNFSEDYNTLYRNEDGKNFTDVTSQAALVQPTLPYVGWGTFFFDYDRDGWLDLFVTNGHVYPQVDRRAGAVAGYRQRNLLFWNMRNGRYQEVGKQAVLGPPAVGRGAASGDLDNDGALDVVINNLDGPPTLLWNVLSTGGHYLILSLEGTTSNRSAVGSQVRLRTGDRWQLREVHSGGSYLSHNDLRVHFGLGSARKADAVEIRWPSGKVTTLKDVLANQILKVKEGN